MIPLSKIASHETQAFGRLLEQYKESANLKAILSVYCDQVQDLEDAIYSMMTERALNEATGVQLDRLGEIVGISRYGRADEVYRVFLAFQIGVNVSNGTLNTILQLFQLITGATELMVESEGHGSVSISYSPGLDPDLEEFIFEAMAHVVAAGVRISGFVTTAGPDSFAFDGGTGLGFSGVYDPTVGGEFAGIVV